MERVPAYQILVGGNDLSDSVYRKIEQVVYEEPEDGEAYFEIHFADNDCSVVDSGKFVKDKTQCALFMGYIGEMDFMMDGIVSGIEPDFPQNDSPTLKITVKNASVVMSGVEKSCAWKGKTYSQIAKAIAKNYGMKANVDDTSKLFKASDSSCIYQTGMSDYAFLASCARKIGYTFRIEYNTLIFKHTVSYDDTVYLDYRMGGCNLLAFKPNADSTNKAKKVYSDNVELSTNDPSFNYSDSPPKTESKPASSGRTYTVKKGDYLIKIARLMYGDGSRFIEIYNVNASKIKMPGYVIFPNQVFTIP